MCSDVWCLHWFIFFFFKQKTAYEMRISDWSSDVCSSDLRELALLNAAALGVQRYPIEFGSLSSRDRSLFHRLTETAVEPTMIIDPRAGMRILDVNDAH